MHSRRLEFLNGWLQGGTKLSRDRGIRLKAAGDLLYYDPAGRYEYPLFPLARIDRKKGICLVSTHTGDTGMGASLRYTVEKQATTVALPFVVVHVPDAHRSPLYNIKQMGVELRHQAECTLRAFYQSSYAFERLDRGFDRRTAYARLYNLKMRDPLEGTLRTRITVTRVRLELDRATPT